jgi:hypothetical protein
MDFKTAQELDGTLQSTVLVQEIQIKAPSTRLRQRLLDL